MKAMIHGRAARLFCLAATAIVFTGLCQPAVRPPCATPVMTDVRPYVRLMDYRKVELEKAAVGLQCSGVPLVAFDDGKYSVAGFADDPGLYLLVPLISRATGLSLWRSADLFLLTVIFSSSLAGLAGLWRCCSMQSGRAVAVAAVALITIAELICGDIYVAQSAVVVATLPWLLWVSREATVKAAGVAVLAGCGLAAGTASLIRGHAGTAVVLFDIVARLGSRFAMRTRMSMIAVLLFCSIAPGLGYLRLAAERDTFLAQQPTAHTYGDAHPFWHSIYVGLGYWPNRHVARYADEVGFAKGRELAPEAASYSPRYEQALRDEVWRIAQSDPVFVARTLTQRLAIVLLIAAASANIGVLVTRRAAANGLAISPFLAALLVSALPGLLVAPQLKYLLGLMAVGAMFGVFAVESAESEVHL